MLPIDQKMNIFYGTSYILTMNYSRIDCSWRLNL